MRITEITSQKNKDRVNIFIDGEFFCGISLSVFSSFNLYKGYNISSDDIHKIFVEEISVLLLNRAVEKIARRPHSEKELRYHLIQVYPRILQNIVKSRTLSKSSVNVEEFKDNEVKQNIIERVISKLKERKYLDDEDFAKWLVSSRQQSSKRGWNAIQFELGQKGISNEIIESLKSEGTTENELAEEVYLKIAKNKAIKKQKLISRLQYRGFSWDSIDYILQKYSDKIEQ
ncbi:RecX family transcriptional regulator [Candidatus Dojkabacteria bacterium]|nr:RecX family transcriptional regulator [Candidatus Dojkabacteria bacterium]